MNKKQPKRSYLAVSFITLLVLGIFIVLPIWGIFTFEKVMLFNYLHLTMVDEMRMIQGFVGSILVGWLAVYLQEWWVSRHDTEFGHGAKATIWRILLTYPFFVAYVYLIWYRLNWSQNLGLILASTAIVTIGWYASRFPEFVIRHRPHH